MSPLASIMRRLRLIVGRGVVRLVNDAGGLQRLQVELYDGELRLLDRVQQYGYTSVPLPGSEAITGSVGGARNHSVVVAVDDRRFRLKGLKAGEVALYTDEGDVLHFRRGRVLEISAGAQVIVNSQQATVNATTTINGLTTINGGLQVNGPITATQPIHSATSVSAPTVMAVSSLTVNGIQVLGHKHPYGTSSITGDMQ